MTPAGVGSPEPAATIVTIRPWSARDLALLTEMNTVEMWAHLGGPEAAEAVVARHERYVHLAERGGDRMFVVEMAGEPAGGVGFWERGWGGETVYETGWMVLPAFRGRGVATAGTAAAVAAARAQGRHPAVHAFPATDNGASNAVCRRVGFSLMGETEFEFPAGSFMRCSDWRLLLRPGRPGGVVP